MPFQIIRNDITKMAVDAIVNTANEEPLYAEGIDSAVYKAAGEEKLLAARCEIGMLQEGEAAVTPGFGLPAKYIIHAVSPFFMDGTHGEEEKLRACYRNSLRLAGEYGCKTLAIPLIATGSYGYPKAEGLEIALHEIQKFLMKSDMMVYLVVFDRESVRLSGQIYPDIASYIDEHYVEEKLDEEYDFAETLVERACAPAQESSLKEEAPERRRRLLSRGAKAKKNAAAPVFSGAAPRSLEDLMKNVGETFAQRLFRLIDERGLKDVEVYKKAGKTKQNFHKIRSNPAYQPSKHTVFAFALALELSLDETKDLLAAAGFAFSPSSKFDLIIQYALEHGIYDIYKVDLILYDFGLEKYYFSCEKE